MVYRNAANAVAGESGLLAQMRISTAGLSTLIPRGNGVFTPEAKSGGSAIGEPVTFVEEGNRVRAIKAGNVFSERVER